MSYKVHCNIRAANEKKLTTALPSLCQKHAIVVAALIEYAAKIASGIQQGMKITSPKDQSKMIRPNQGKIRREREREREQKCKKNRIKKE